MHGVPTFGYQSHLPLRILSHNIRYATSSLFENERPWAERLPLITNELHYNTRPYSDVIGTDNNEHRADSVVPFSAAFICLQEVLHGQLSDILHSLNGVVSNEEEDSTLPSGPAWAHIGVAREDGHQKGEYSPIIYPVRVFHLLHFENLWLSPTPDRPSKGWDAGSERILTSGVFEHKYTGQRLLACCTHLDNAGSESRKHSVDIILRTIQRLRQQWSEPETPISVFLAGDFNSLPDQEAYLKMAGSDLMGDLRDYVEPKRRYGDLITFTGFTRDQDKEDQGRLDFIWLGPKQQVSGRQCPGETDGSQKILGSSGWKVNGYAVLPNVFEDGVYSSDHRCVVGDVSLRTP